jgi:uncharacterized OB-fold protein
MSDAATRIDWSQGVPLMAGPYFLGLYQPSPETKDFWDGIAQHELRLKWCPNCARAHHPKRIVCTFCGNTELASKRAAGRGTVYSFSEVHRAAVAAFAAATPYTVGVVKLVEGVHLFSRLIPSSGPIAIDDPVDVDFRVLEMWQLLPVFIVGKK